MLDTDFMLLLWRRWHRGAAKLGTLKLQFCVCPNYQPGSGSGSVSRGSCGRFSVNEYTPRCHCSQGLPLLPWCKSHQVSSQVRLSLCPREFSRRRVTKIQSRTLKNEHDSCSESRSAKQHDPGDRLDWVLQEPLWDCCVPYRPRPTEHPRKIFPTLIKKKYVEFNKKWVFLEGF